MGLFDFFKKKDTQNSEKAEQKMSKDDVQDLILFALNELCGDKTLDDVRQILKSKNLTDRQIETILARTNEMYAKYFDKEKTLDVDKSSEGNNVQKFELISKYASHIKVFMNMQLQSNFAPIGAYETSTRGVVGFLYMIKDIELSISTLEAVQKMTKEFDTKLERKEINSYVILYHSQFNNDNNHTVANNDEEFRAISIKYKTNNGLVGFEAMPYEYKQDGLTYLGFNNLSNEQNSTIFNIPLDNNIDYFEDRVHIEIPYEENNLGIKIKKANVSSLSNMWGGIAGFETWNKAASPLRTTLMVYTSTKPAILSKGSISLHRYNEDIVTLNMWKIDNKSKIYFPNVHTKEVLSFETKEIKEYIESDNLEALISGNGKTLFGLDFYASDYAINREFYLSQKHININISAICLVLDIGNITREGFDTDFAGYVPNDNLGALGIYDFIGPLRAFKEISILENNVNGYLLTVNIVRNEQGDDYFILDMFVNKENMRFENLEIGMKLTGAIQFLGQIAA